MYIPTHFKIDNRDFINRIIDNFGFATLVTQMAENPNGYPTITHIPLFRDGDYLYGHVARANKHWKLLAGGYQTTAIFQGPHGYISPLNYKSANKVPTWNYVAVHVTGTAEILDQEEDINKLLNLLAQQYEGDQGWKPEMVDEKNITGLKRGIVCFRLSMDDIQCKAKLDQNKPQEDREGAIEALEASINTLDQQLAIYMKGEMK